MKILNIVATAVALTLATPAVALAKVKVVATLPDLACVAREVGGPDVEVTALAVPTQDPHFVDARPSLVLPLNRADLLVLSGLQLEVGWLPNLITGARNPKIQQGANGYFDASSVASILGARSGAVNRSMGDIHPGGNPHFMLDPREGARVAKALAERMGAIDPAHKAGFAQRAAALATAANAQAAKEAKRFAALPADRRRAVAYHDSLVYLFTWLGIKQMGTLEPKPGIPPSPEHVASTMAMMKREHVPVVTYEGYRPRNTGQLVAGKTNARLAIFPGGPNFDGGESYLTWTQDVANKLYEGFKP
jgi:zinc/manganese transport system substrate-binding protein